MSQEVSSERRIARFAAFTITSLLALSSAAMGQDADIASVETEAEMNPGDLPGRENAPRTATKSTLPPPAPVPAPPSDREWFGGLSWFEWSRATGDWGGVRTRLEDAGLSIGASLTHDWSYVFDGGVNNRGSSRRLFDINATLDLEKALGWKGGTLYADFYHYGGRLINDAGDIMSYDNIATDRHRDQLSEAWFQ